MKKEILQALQEIEAKYEIQILYACESGSRARGFASTDSDYDVRFIYKHTFEWYLSINEKKDTIELPINQLLDIGGWDILKTLKLVRNSNAVIWEWMQSPIIYLNKNGFLKRIWETAKDYYALKSGCYHYLAQVRNGIKEHFIKDSIKIKQYFYILRPLLAAMWIFEKKAIPPMMFIPLTDSLLSETKSEMPVLTNIIADNDRSILESINKLIEAKKQAAEKDYIKRIPLLDEFIETGFNGINEKVYNLSGKNSNIEPLNVFFRDEIK